MKKLYKFFLPATLFSLVSCWDYLRQPVPEYESRYEPVVVSRSDLQNIKMEVPKTAVENSKIYLKDNFIFVNDRKAGFQIIDNSIPDSPKKLKFLRAVGSTDVAMRGDIMYVNQARDLVALRVNPTTGTVQVLKRIENVFPAVVSPDGEVSDVGSNKVVIDWKRKN